MSSYFITGTSTGVGKTYVSRALAAALRSQGRPVAAIKPIETGCAPDPADALALAKACGRPQLAEAPGLYRAEPPLAPLAAERLGAGACDLDAVVATTRGLMLPAGWNLIEGAGGPLVPITAQTVALDLAEQLSLPTILVAANALGVLSSTLTAAAAIEKKSRLALCVLSPAEKEDLSSQSNAQLLRELLPCPVLQVPYCEDDDAQLATNIGARLVETLIRTQPAP